MINLDSYRSKVGNECYLIKKGVRSCALVTITFDINDNPDDIDEALYRLDQDALQFDCRTYWKKMELDEEYGDDRPSYSFWIYRYDHQLPLIKVILNSPAKTYITEWMTGKLLGYSDADMEEYLSRQVLMFIDLEDDLKSLNKKD